MPHGCPRPRMRWNGAIGAIARGKKVSTVCAPKSRARHALRLIGGETPGARGVATLFTPYMRPGQDESNPVSLLQCQIVGMMCPPLFGCRTNSELCRVRGWDKNLVRRESGK